MSNTTELKDPILMAAIVSAIQAYMDTESVGANKYSDIKKKWRHVIANDFVHVSPWKQVMYLSMYSY